MIVTLMIIALFIALGFVFLSGKGAFLSAGYNTMPQEEKDKLDEVALCKFMGKVMFALASCMVFWVLSEALISNGYSSSVSPCSSVTCCSFSCT